MLFNGIDPCKLSFYLNTLNSCYILFAAHLLYSFGMIDAIKVIGKELFSQSKEELAAWNVY
jgi:hypothetical protein